MNQTRQIRRLNLLGACAHHLGMRTETKALVGLGFTVTLFLVEGALQIGGYQSEPVGYALGALAVCAGIFTVVMYLRLRKEKGELKMPKIGDESVALGDVTHDVGNRSVFIRPAPGETNVMYNKGGTAIGYKAKADPTSVSIGAYAGGGRDDDDSNKS